MFKICIIICIVLIILLVLVIIESLRELRMVRTVTYDIESDKVTEDKTFVFISDYHEAHHLNDKIKSAIDEVSPDAVLIGGDMINGSDHDPQDMIRSAGELLRDISKRYPVYYAFGNHELKLSNLNFESWKEYESSFGSDIYLLSNESISLEGNIKLYGLGIPREYYGRGFGFPRLSKDKINELIGEVDKNSFSILLGHAPDFIEGYTGWGADLSLAGHFHGGMVRLPIVGGVISPRLLLFPKYDYGLYIHNSKREIVTNGLGQHSIKLRLNNIPEIVQINIRKTKGR